MKRTLICSEIDEKPEKDKFKVSIINFKNPFDSWWSNDGLLKLIPILLIYSKDFEQFIWLIIMRI